MMQLAFPTAPHLKIIQVWGNPNPKLYANGRHMGVDIAGPVGAPIYAACPGVVTLVSERDLHGYGRHVILQHEGFKTLYAHLHKVKVAEKQVVLAGAVLGQMGGDPRDDDPIDGASTGPHLHFEVILPVAPPMDFIRTFAGYTVDPFAYLLNCYGETVIKTGVVEERSGVRVRISPGTSGADVVIDALGYRREIEIVEEADRDGDLWVRIRSLRPEWACARYQGRQYIRLRPAPVADTPATEEIPTQPPVLDDKAIRRDEIDRLIALLEDRKRKLA